MKTSRRRTSAWIAAALVAAVLAAALLARRGRGGGAAPENPLYTVTSGPLDITVGATGSIQSRKSVSVMSEVEGKNTVIWVIEEGRSVTNGQMLIELDSSEQDRQFAEQRIVVGNAEAALAQSNEKLAIAQISKENAIFDANLALDLAKLALEKYKSGQYPQQLQEAENNIALAQEELQRAEEALGWTEKLAKEGYITRQELQADSSTVRQKKIALESSITSLNVLTNYTAREETAKLEAAVRQAESKLDIETRQANANLSQAESEKDAKQQEYDRQVEKLEKLRDQVAKCRIFAPTNGIVIYASTMQSSKHRWGGDPLEAGVEVHQRQELFFIPLPGEMTADFTVPESDLPKLKEGVVANVQADALPDRVFTGRLSKIGLLPDARASWMNPDMNLYNCQLVMDPDLADGLRAGMSCRINMLVDSYKDAVSVPLQCVLRVHGEPCVFFLDNGKPVARQIKTGLDNGRFVHVVEGLKAGDRVMLTPPLSEAEKGHGADAPSAKSGRPARPKAKAAAGGMPPAGK